MWRRRSKKKRFFKRGKFFWLIPIFLVFLFLYLFLKSELFIVKEINIQTNQLSCSDESQIRNALNISGQNLFLINSTIVEGDLKKKFYCIKYALINRIFPDKVKIRIFSREAAVVLVNLKEQEASTAAFLENIATPSGQEVKNSYQVDTEGVIFSRATDGLNVPKIYFDEEVILGQKLENNLVSNTLRILEKLKTAGIEVSESWIRDGFFIINSSIRLKIIFRLNEKIDVQLASLQLILDKAKIDLKELEFIDLRFDKPVVRYAPKK